MSINIQPKNIFDLPAEWARWHALIELEDNFIIQLVSLKYESLLKPSNLYGTQAPFYTPFKKINGKSTHYINSRCVGLSRSF